MAKRYDQPDIEGAREALIKMCAGETRPTPDTLLHKIDQSLSYTTTQIVGWREGSTWWSDYYCGGAPHATYGRTQPIGKSECGNYMRYMEPIDQELQHQGSYASIFEGWRHSIAGEFRKAAAAYGPDFDNEAKFRAAIRARARQAPKAAAKAG